MTIQAKFLLIVCGYMEEFTNLLLWKSRVWRIG
jgi:hypothetical protein